MIHKLFFSFCISYSNNFSLYQILYFYNWYRNETLPTRRYEKSASTATRDAGMPLRVSILEMRINLQRFMNMDETFLDAPRRGSHLASQPLIHSLLKYDAAVFYA